MGPLSGGVADTRTAGPAEVSIENAVRARPMDANKSERIAGFIRVYSRRRAPT
jgi:hypothetical protein